MSPPNAVCSQWGTWPSERYPDHPSDGGFVEFTLTHYDPPEVFEFAMCRRCANEGFIEEHGLFPVPGPDPRFRWVREPSP